MALPLPPLAPPRSPAGITLDYQRIDSYAGSVVMNGDWHQVPFDTAANGDIREWALKRFETRWVPMRVRTGATNLAARSDPTVVAGAIAALKSYVYAVTSRHLIEERS